ncbi:MAG: class I adenylate-forming enzyme family protein [Gallionellaceae bacterium]|nr:class I adenylate-forming enzyme family protein [Gallionellaceae bacterium]
MLIEHLQRLAYRHGREIAVIDDDRRVTFAELWQQVDALAGQLGRQGLVPGQCAGISIKPEFRHFLTSLALMRLGCVQITLPTYESAQYRKALAEKAGVQVQLIDLAEHALADFAAIIPVYEFDQAGPAEHRLPSDEAACIYFVTSGTTGKPKLIPLSQRQLFQQGTNWQYPPGQEIFWRPTPIEYNNSKRQRLYNLVSRSTNIFLDPTGRDMLEVVEHHGVTRLNLSVMQSRHLLQNLRATSRRLPDFCQVRIGGSAVSPDLRAALVRDLTANLHITYATSEFGSIATAGPGHHFDLEITGVVHPGVDLRIVDDSGNVLPAGQVGHIEVKGSGMADHYRDDEAATDIAFRGEWFHPGDMGHLSSAGLLYVSGRADDMMSLASINIFPSEIEAAFASYPGLIECAAFALKSSAFGDIPLLAIVGSDELDLAAMSRFGRDRLGLRAPRKLFRVSALPRNRGGKVLKDELRALFDQQIK